MRIATFNVNNILSRIGPLSAWLDVTKPDVVCLQELKCTDSQFPREALRELGYEALVHGQKSWNGVAILSRTSTPIRSAEACPAILAISKAATSRRP